MSWIGLRLLIENWELSLLPASGEECQIPYLHPLPTAKQQRQKWLTALLVLRIWRINLRGFNLQMVPMGKGK